MTKVEIVDRIYRSLLKLPESVVSQIIAGVLRKFDRHGLAELVEKGWNWKPTEGDTVEDTAN